MLNALRWFCLVLVLVVVSPVGAQETPAPLLDLVVRLPAPSGELSRDLSYVDMATIRAAHPNLDLLDPKGPAAAYVAGSPALADLFQADMNGMQQAIGIRFADIDRVLTYGTPPGFITILQGTFDGGAVRAALDALGFVTDSPDPAYTRFCNPEGCDHAADVSFKTRNLANPFGGQLGRYEAIALFDRPEPGMDILMSSPAYRLLEATAARFAAAEVSDSDPSLLQTVSALQSAAGDQALAAALIVPTNAVGENTVRDTALPPYEALAIGAYTAAEGTGHAEVALIYADGAQVEAVPPAVAARLDQPSAFARGKTYKALFEERGVTVSDFRYQPLEDGWGALMVTLTTEGRVNFGYALLIRLLMARDLGWLAP